MSPATPERRTRKAPPPRRLEVAYDALAPEQKALFTKAGFFTGAFSLGVPLLAGIWYELSGYYWIFSGAGLLIALLLIFPPFLIYVVKFVPGAVAKVLPSKVFGRQERRQESE